MIAAATLKGMNQPLVPQQRPDKNGKVTTRWVKADNAPALAMSTIPSPVPQQPAISRQTLLIASAELVASNIVDNERKLNDLFEIAHAHLDEMSTSTIEMVNDIRGSEWRAYFLMDCMENDESEAFICDYLQLADHIELKTDSADETAPYVRMLSQYPKLCPYTPGDEYPQLRKDQATGIISVTSSIEELISDGELPEDAIQYTPHDYDFGKTPLIADQRISDLIIERPDDAERIAEFIEDRASLDYDLIMEWLGAETPAVSSGLL